MDTWSAVSWTWRALRGHSVTFAGLFACGLLGISVLAAFRRLLIELGAPWYAWLLVPIVAIAYVAKKESEWLPDPVARQTWARRIFFGSIILAILIAKLTPPPASAVAEPAAVPTSTGGAPR